MIGYFDTFYKYFINYAYDFAVRLLCLNPTPTNPYIIVLMIFLAYIIWNGLLPAFPVIYIELFNKFT